MWEVSVYDEVWLQGDFPCEEEPGSRPGTVSPSLPNSCIFPTFEARAVGEDQEDGGSAPEQFKSVPCFQSRDRWGASGDSGTARLASSLAWES